MTKGSWRIIAAALLVGCGSDPVAPTIERLDRSAATNLYNGVTAVLLAHSRAAEGPETVACPQGGSAVVSLERNQVTDDWYAEQLGVVFQQGCRISTISLTGTVEAAVVVIDQTDLYVAGRLNWEESGRQGLCDISVHVERFGDLTQTITGTACDYNL